MSNGIFETAQISKEDERIQTPSSNKNNEAILHPAIDLLRKELTGYIQQEFTSDGLHILTLS